MIQTLKLFKLAYILVNCALTFTAIPQNRSNPSSNFNPASRINPNINNFPSLSTTNPSVSNSWLHPQTVANTLPSQTASTFKPQAQPRFIQPIIYNPSNSQSAANSPVISPTTSNPPLITSARNSDNSAPRTPVSKPTDPVSPQFGPSVFGAFGSIAPIHYPFVCPSGSSWNITQFKCVCTKSDQTYNPTSKQCECEGQLKVNAAGICVKCDIPNIWDTKSSVCVSCPDGFTFNQTTSLCACPAAKPYLNAQNVCQACETTWDDKTLTCLSCSVNQTWKTGAKKCECKASFNTDSKGGCVVCESPQMWDEIKKTCGLPNYKGFFASRMATCPPDRPYLDASKVCQSCNTIWNYSMRMCCPAGYNMVNPETFQCDIG